MKTTQNGERDENGRKRKELCENPTKKYFEIKQNQAATTPGKIGQALPLNWRKNLNVYIGTNFELNQAFLV